MRDVLLVLMMLAVKLASMSVWVAGLVVAHGFWSTFFALIFPPWSLYLVAEQIMHVMGWIS